MVTTLDRWDVIADPAAGERQAFRTLIARNVVYGSGMCNLRFRHVQQRVPAAAVEAGTLPMARPAASQELHLVDRSGFERS